MSSTTSGAPSRQAGVDVHFWLTDALKNYNMQSFPKELLQNSDDANCTDVMFVFDEKTDTLWHWQDIPLKEKDFQALGNFYSHTKAEDATKIGKFGVGFCTVFHVTNKPHCFSGGKQWIMDLQSLNVFEPQGEAPALPDGFPATGHKPGSGALFQFPFRSEPLHVNDKVFRKPNFADALAVFERVLQPSCVFFLSNVRRLRLAVISKDGSTRLIRDAMVKSDALNRVTKQKLKALSPPLQQLTPQEVSEVQLQTLAEDGKTYNTEPWWYCVAIGPVLKTAKLPIVLQLAAPQNKLLEGPATIAVGLPLTGTESPILCHCSATLILDATRVIIRTDGDEGEDNQLVFNHLAHLYCSKFVPRLDPYDLGDNWPLNWDVVGQHGAMGIFASLVGHYTVKHCKFALRHGEDHQKPTAPFSNLTFLAEGSTVDENILEIHQRVALQVTDGCAVARLGPRVTRKLQDLRITFNEFGVQTFKQAISKLRVRSLDSAIPEVSDRYLALQFMLQKSPDDQRAQILQDVPLRCSINGWSRFDVKRQMFSGKEAHALLLDPELDVVASAESEKLFELYPVHEMVSPLTVDLLFSQQLLADGVPYAQAIQGEKYPEYALEVWRFLTAAKNKSKIKNKNGFLTPEQIGSLKDLPLLQTQDGEMVPCGSASDLVVVGQGSAALIEPVLAAVGLQRLHKDFSSAVNALPALEAASSTNIAHVVNLLLEKLKQMAPPTSTAVAGGGGSSDGAFSEQDAARVREYIERAGKDLNEDTRKAIHCLPIYPRMGSDRVSVPLRLGPSHPLHPFIVQQAIFDELPRFVKIHDMVGVPDGLAAVIGVAVKKELHVAEEVLQERFWVPLDDDTKKAVFEWVAKNHPHLVSGVFVPTCQQGHWAPLKTLCWAPVRTHSDPVTDYCRKIYPSAVADLTKCEGVTGHPAATKELKLITGSIVSQMIGVAISNPGPSQFSAPLGTTLPVLIEKYVPPGWKTAMGIASSLISYERTYDKVLHEMRELNSAWIPAISRLEVPLDVDFDPKTEQLEGYTISMQLPKAVYDVDMFDLSEGLPIVPIASYVRTKSRELAVVTAANFIHVARRWRSVALRDEIWPQCAQREGVCPVGCSPRRPKTHSFRVIEAMQDLVYTMMKYPAELPKNWQNEWIKIMPPFLKCFPFVVGGLGRLVAPRELISSDAFFPFWPSAPNAAHAGSHFWRSLYEIPAVPRFEVSSLYMHLNWWSGKSIRPEEISALKALLSHFAPHFPEVVNRTPLPGCNLKMIYSNKLHYMYGDMQVSPEVLEATKDLLIHPDLAPGTFDFPPLFRLGLTSIRVAVQQPIEAVADGNMQGLQNLMLSRLQHPLFATVLEKVTQRTGTSARTLRGLELVFASSLTLKWVKQPDLDVAFSPAQAIEQNPKDHDAIRFFIKSRDASGKRTLDEEELRGRIVACICEHLALPAGIRRDLLTLALKRDSADLQVFLKEYFQEVGDEHGDEEGMGERQESSAINRRSDGGGSSIVHGRGESAPDEDDDKKRREEEDAMLAAKLAQEEEEKHKKQNKQDTPATTTGGSTSTAGAGGVPHPPPHPSPTPQPEGSLGGGAGSGGQQHAPLPGEEQMSVSDHPVPRPVQPPKKPELAPIDTPVDLRQKNGHFYGSGGPDGQQPAKKMPGTMKGNVGTPPSAEQDKSCCDDEPTDLELWREQRSNTLPLFINKGDTLPSRWQNHGEVWSAARSLTEVLFDAAQLLDPRAFSHCFVYWTNKPTKTMAFNLGGWLGFNLTFFMRCPDPFEWMCIFAHEYNHNDHPGHDVAFINGVQSRCASMMRVLANPPPSGRRKQCPAQISHYTSSGSTSLPALPGANGRSGRVTPPPRSGHVDPKPPVHLPPLGDGGATPPPGLRGGPPPSGGSGGGKWTCQTCTVENTDPKATRCFLCETERIMPPPPAANTPSPPAYNSPPGSNRPLPPGGLSQTPSGARQRQIQELRGIFPDLTEEQAAKCVERARGDSTRAANYGIEMLAKASAVNRR